MDHTRISSAQLYEYRIPFTRPFVTSGQTFRERQGLIAVLQSSEGETGLGEIAPLPGFNRENLNDARSVTESLLPRLPDQPIPTSPAEISDWWQAIHSSPLPPSVEFGIECAMIDLASQRAHRPAARWLNARSGETAVVNAVISGSDAEIAASAKTKLAQGYRTFKLKIGSNTMAEDIRRIELLRTTIGPAATIRLDANGAYTFDDALALLPRVAQLRIEYVEEPLRDLSWNKLLMLKAAGSVSIALDESLSLMLESQHSNSLRAFDVAIIKAPVIGGPTRCLDLIRRLRQNGIDCVMTSALDTAVGVSAALHLAAAAQLGDTACGLDTLDLLARPLPDHALVIDQGAIRLPASPGLAVVLTADSMSRLTRISDAH